MVIKQLFAEMSLTHALKRVLQVSVLVSIYCGLVYCFFEAVYSYPVPGLSYFQSVFGVVLGLLLVFRSNRAYERWWEARILWGQLVNSSRSLAIKIGVLLRPTPKEAIIYAQLITNFCEALALHLRQCQKEADLKKIISTTQLPSHIPSFLAKKLYHSLFQNPHAQEGFNLVLLDEEINKFVAICGGCERIKNTFISLSFRVFVKHVFIIFVLILPWSLLPELGAWSIPATILITYLIMAVEGIARNLEEPFGLTEDHLNLGSYTKAIKESVHQILLESEDSRRSM